MKPHSTKKKIQTTAPEPNWATKELAFGVAKRHGGAKGRGGNRQRALEVETNRYRRTKTLNKGFFSFFLP